MGVSLFNEDGAAKEDLAGNVLQEAKISWKKIS